MSRPRCKVLQVFDPESGRHYRCRVNGVKLDRNKVLTVPFKSGLAKVFWNHDCSRWERKGA